MACPSCGKKIHSDFKLSGLTRRVPRRNFLKDLFGMPYNILCLIRDFMIRKWHGMKHIIQNRRLENTRLFKHTYP